MKLSISIIVPLVVLAAVFIGGYFLSSSFETPQARLDAEVDAQVEVAQRLLSQYNAAVPQLERAFTAAATQPENIEADKWQSYLEQDAEQSPFASVKEQLDAHQQQLAQLSREVGALNGAEPAVAPQPGASEGYANVVDGLKANRELLDQALNAVANAISLAQGEGEAEARGSNHPVATRLQAILLHHKADLLRREAALLRGDAESNRDQFERVAVLCRALDEEIQGQKGLLVGGAAPGKGSELATAAPAQSEPAAEPAAEPVKPAKAEGADAKPKPAETPKAKSGGLFDLLVGRAKQIVSKPGAKSSAAPEHAVAAPEPVTEPAPVQPPSAQADAPAANVPAAEPGPDESVAPIADRIAQLQRDRAAAAGAQQAAQTEVERLSKQVEEITGRIAAAHKTAHQAEVKMIEAELKGVQADEYRRLSQTYREASREAVALEQGAIRNAKSAVTDPDDILQSPLVPQDDAKPMEPERGKAALDADLLAAKTAVQTNKALLAEVDRQIAELTARREVVQARVQRLEGQRRQTLDEAQRFADAVFADVLRAGLLEGQALEIVIGPGAQAAQRARSAASKHQSQVQQFVRSENPAELPDRKLTDMAADQSSVAHAAMIEGDLNYLAARIRLQQAEDLAHHQDFIADLQAIGLSPKLDVQHLPEGVQAEAVPEYLTQPEKLPQVIKDEQTEAAKAARQALDQYTQAAAQLKELWVVHTNIAAVHNMLAGLPRLENDTEDHVTAARQTYTRAIQGREKRPEYEVYRRIANSLAVNAAPAPAANPNP